MSGLTGKGSLSIKKKEVAQSRLPAVAFRKVRALHQCSANQTVINITSLTTPDDAVNYSAPNPSLMASVNMFELQDNVEIRSSIRGALMQNLAYVITGASTIELLFEAEDGEALEIVIDHVARTGTTLVDARPLVVSDTLLAGETDFNVGEPFKVGEHILAQHGSVLVMVDNQLMYRNTSNQAPGLGVTGDYYEVHAGGGLGTIIRFNVPDLTNDRTVSVISVGSLVERPNGSQMALIEAVQGQIDAMVPTLAALAGVDETDFQAQPNNVDLKAFGDSVLALKQRLDNATYDQYSYLEYSGQTRLGSNRLVPSTLNQSVNPGSFDLSNLANGEFKVTKNGWYSFNIKSQMTGLGTASITRNNSVGLNGNSADILVSLVPVSAQEYFMHWEGYLTAGTIIAFNCGTALSTNDNRLMMFVSYLGSKNLSSI